MAKKNREDDELEDDVQDVQETEIVEDEQDDDDDSSSDDSISLSDEDDNIDIMIEIDEDDLDIIEKDQEASSEEESNIVLSKHKMEGKHSLKYDSIFKGKKEVPLDEDDPDGFALYHKDTIEVDKSSNYYFESM
jgi:hypothetical protein